MNNESVSRLNLSVGASDDLSVRIRVSCLCHSSDDSCRGDGDFTHRFEKWSGHRVVSLFSGRVEVVLAFGKLSARGDKTGVWKEKRVIRKENPGVRKVKLETLGVDHTFVSFI